MTMPRPMAGGAALRVARLDLMLLWRNRTALFTAAGLPVLFAALLFPPHGQKAGVMFPLDGLPPRRRRRPAGGWAACLASFAVLAVWLGAGRAMAGSWFRWEPRRA
ncbi:hypothetical protein [Actinomadura nitritigenes]|uniref:hypothetical protein n=1 Tax=Actinomadura nitritigenes TaxID=134602 RepID=UPI003D94743E